VSDAGEEQFESGLQRERTALAWNRTALALLVAGSLLTRHIGPPYFDLAHAPGYAALVAGVAVLWYSVHDERWRTEAATHVAQLRPQLAWGIGLVTLLLNVVSLVLVATGR
jgi:uncharacterized membrane protein YidH (DUF202 family)